MGFLDALRGRGRPTGSKDTTSKGQEEELTQFQPSYSGGGGAAAIGGGGKQFNPYEGLVLDPKVSYEIRHPVLEHAEHLFAEDSLKKRRSIFENQQYFTGLGYLGGIVGGGLYGGLQARGEITKQMAAGGYAANVGKNKILINRVVNGVAHQGKNFGNTLGVLGFLFASSQGLSRWIIGERFSNIPDEVLTLGAGCATGVVYRMHAGPRAAGVSAGLGFVAAGAVLILEYFDTL